MIPTTVPGMASRGVDAVEQQFPFLLDADTTLQLVAVVSPHQRHTR